MTVHNHQRASALSPGCIAAERTHKASAPTMKDSESFLPDAQSNLCVFTGNDDSETNEASLPFTPASSSSDSEARCIVQELFPKEGHSSSPERLIVATREMKKAKGGYWVDDMAAISDRLAVKVAKASCMLLTEAKNLRTRKIEWVFGQIGIIQQTSDKVSLVTNLHNVMSENPSEGGDTLLAKRVRLRLANGCDFDACFEELGTYLDTLRAVPLREAEGKMVSWKYGIDITFGTFDIIPGESTFEEEGLHAFECVEPDFEYVEGLKIAMVIYTTQEPKQEGAPSEKMRTVYGFAEHANIHTGQVTYVGQSHIEHDINTYTSFSGAAIFLLDGPDQHRSVDHSDYGKVIAVHTGFKKEFGMNFGFKIHATEGESK